MRLGLEGGRSSLMAQYMPSVPDLPSPACRRAILALGALAAALAMQAFWRGEEAWSAAVWLLSAAGLGFVVFVLIWLSGLKAQRLLRALRDSAVLGLIMALFAVAGNLLRENQLRPTKQRVEMLATAISEHQRVHGVLPQSLDEIEATRTSPTDGLYPISYKPQSDGTFTMFFTPSWYRHEYSSARRSWRVFD